jgi:phage gp36-like protein
MKFGEDTLLEIVEIVRRGLVDMKDISQSLRDVDLEIRNDRVCLTSKYVKGRNYGPPDQDD